MGIKDKVLDILFDEDDEELKKKNNTSTIEKRKHSTNSLLDTGSIFIDATSPLPKEKKRYEPEERNSIEIETEQFVDNSNNKDYRLSENISPIFGPIDNKGKVKKQSIVKTRKGNDTSINGFDGLTKNSNSSYTSIVISPFFGPLATKQNKKSSKTRKKASDPFERDITDTGSFDAVINNDDEQIAPNFEDAEEDTEPVIEEKQPLMDTDKIARISDKINRIKNQAANIYDDNASNEPESELEDSSANIESSSEQYTVKTEVHSNISDVIHNLKDNDGQYVQTKPSYQDLLPREEVSSNSPSIQSTSLAEETTSSNLNEQKPQEESALPNNIINNANVFSNQLSVDDIFDEEEEVEESKDLFSVLFGDD